MGQSKEKGFIIIVCLFVCFVHQFISSFFHLFSLHLSSISSIFRTQWKDGGLSVDHLIYLPTLMGSLSIEPSRRIGGLSVYHLIYPGINRRMEGFYSAYHIDMDGYKDDGR